LAYLGPVGFDAGSLAAYVRRAADGLTEQPRAQILAGQIVWPDPMGGQEAN
jgi:hypothetical protein